MRQSANGLADPWRQLLHAYVSHRAAGLQISQRPELQSNLPYSVGVHFGVRILWVVSISSQDEALECLRSAHNNG